jgi:ribonuclease P protein component
MAEGQPRLGLVATRRLGKAVQRNRIKRVLREFFRRHRTTLPAFDLVIMAKKGAAALGYHQVEEELGRLLFSRARQKTHD